MTNLIANYGLWALCVGVMLESAGMPVPGETALIVAAVLAAHGLFSLSSVIAVAAVAAAVGDNVGYWIGRRGGRLLLERWRPLAQYADRILPPAEHFFASHGGKSVFLARFIPVLRVAGAFTAGVARMPWWRFVLWNVAGGVTWAAAVGVVAYNLGAAAAATIGRFGLVGTAIVIAGAAIVFILMLRVRRAQVGKSVTPFASSPDPPHAAGIFPPETPHSAHDGARLPTPSTVHHGPVARRAGPRLLAPGQVLSQQSRWWSEHDMVTRLIDRFYERRLFDDVRRGHVPRHLGLIQDGHRRYAREAGFSNVTGYRLGAAKAEEVLTWCAQLKIPIVTLWWLSTENLSREPDDVAAVLEVIEGKLPEWIQGGWVERLGIRIRPIGKLERLPASVRRALQLAESSTRDHDRLLLNIGVGYGGRQEIIDAIQGYLHDSFRRQDPPDDIVRGLTADAVAKYLYTYDCPDPDLIIRTSGEVRLSGFMLWQSAYSEYYFCDAYWPAFRRIDFLRAVRSYQQRQRRFGR
jgi:short-chain Z-isoprenyl diphosphate synthase